MIISDNMNMVYEAIVKEEGKQSWSIDRPHTIWGSLWLLSHMMCFYLPKTGKGEW